MAGVVLQGRSEPMGSALGLIRKVMRTGQGASVVITGEAGIGKSALLSAVLREAVRLGAVCGSVRADRIGRIVPRGPLLTALRDGPDPVLSAQAYAPLDSLASQPLLLLDAAVDALEQRAAERTVVMAIDDAQWLDDLSAFVLRSLPGRLADSPVAWLLASRTAGLPLLEALRGRPAEDSAPIHIALGPLASSDIIAIARDQLGTVPGIATRQMLERAGGNPFMAVQVISGLLHAQARGSNLSDLPGKLVRAVRRQLRTLPSRAVELVRLATVYGEPLSVDDAAELLDGVSAQAVAEAADAAIEAGMLSSEQGALLFRHSLVRESVYADLPERARQFIHLTYARHLRQSGYDALTVAAQAREVITPGDEPVALLLAGDLTLGGDHLDQVWAIYRRGRRGRCPVGGTARDARGRDPAHLVAGRPIPAVGGLGGADRCRDAGGRADR